MNTPTAVLFWFSLSLIPGVIPRGKREDSRRAIHLAAIFIFVMLAVINIWYHTKTQISSDTVTMLPVAEDFLSGNWLLKHWILGTNNFFFTETIFYAVGMALGFSRQAMIGSITCLFYSATVVLMAIYFLIRDDGYEGLPWNTRVKLAACFVPTVGICAWPMAYTLLNANSHNNLYFFMCFCILFLLAWMRERKRWCLIAYFLLGVILVFSEGFATMTLIGPVILFGLWGAVFEQKRRWRGVMLAAVSVAAWLAAKAVGAIISAAGGLVTLGLPMGLVFSPRTLASRVYHFLIISEKFFYTGTLEFLGIHLPEGIYHAIAIAGIVVFLAGLVIALFRVMKLSDIDRLLLIIVVLNLAGCFFFDVDIHFRYLVPTWIFGSIVSLKQLFLLAHAVLGDRERVMKGLYVTLALCTAFTTAKKLATINDNLVAGEKERDVVAYLEDNHYGAGYGVFWASSNISYYSDNGLDIKPIIIDGEGVYKYFELIRDDWYQWNDRRYFIIKKDEQARYDRFIRLYIGEPLDIATIHEYVIYRWADDFTGLLEEYDREAKARGE